MVQELHLDWINLAWIPKAANISWRSPTGKRTVGVRPQRTAWKRVLREPPATTAAKRKTRINIRAGDIRKMLAEMTNAAARIIGCLAGIAGWPVVARGKQPEIPVIGYLDSLGPQTGASELNIFRKALSKAGYVEGRNVSIEFRWAEGQRDRLPALAADLVRLRVTVIVVTVSDPVGCGIGGQGRDGFPKSGLDRPVFATKY